MLPSCISSIAARLAFQEEGLSHIVLDPSNRWASDRSNSFLGGGGGDKRPLRSAGFGVENILINKQGAMT